MVFTIEPMLNAGQRETKELANGWTAVTKDQLRAAEREKTGDVTRSGYEVLAERWGEVLRIAPSRRSPRKHLRQS